MPDPILVTGAAGFIGFHVAKRLLDDGHAAERVGWVTICSPNYLHDAHMRLALRNGANAICEKPPVISPWNLDALEQQEAETGRRIFTSPRLRVHPALVAIKARLDAEPAGTRHLKDAQPVHRDFRAGDVLHSQVDIGKLSLAESRKQA